VVYLVNLLRLTFKTPKKSSLLSSPLCSSNVRVCVHTMRSVNTVRNTFLKSLLSILFRLLRFSLPRFPPLHFCYTRVFHSRVFSRPRLDANSVASRQALDLGRHSGAHASGLLCERDVSFRWCSSWTSGRSKDSQIRHFGTEYRQVAYFNRSQQRCLTRWMSHHRFLSGAGPQDRVYFRRQPRAQLSFPAHFDYWSAL